MNIRNLLIPIFLLVISLNTLKAQGDLDVLLASAQEDVDMGLEDANYLVEGYISPFMNGIGLGLCNGWFNTAKPHKTLGFDIGLVTGLAYIPDEDLFYDITGLQVMQSRDGDTEAPTIFGPTTAPFYELKSDANVYYEAIGGFDMKKEIGFNAVPYAVPQLGIGIIKGTDIKLRLLPKVTIGGDEGSVKVFGLGIMHDITQHIAGLKNIPFNLSGLVGFTNVDINYDYTDPQLPDSVASGQFEMKSMTAQVIISKELSVATFYGSLGYNIAKSNLKMLGRYTVDQFPNNPLIPTIEVEDPIDLDFNASGPRFTAGLRLKLTVLTLNVDYTFQKYSTLNFGLGFSVR